MSVHTFDISIYLILSLYHLYVFTLLQKFYTAKDTVNRANMESTEWEKSLPTVHLTNYLYRYTKFSKS